MLFFSTTEADSVVVGGGVGAGGVGGVGSMAAHDVGPGVGCDDNADSFTDPNSPSKKGE